MDIKLDVIEVKKILDIKSFRDKWIKLIPKTIYHMTLTYEWFYATWRSLTGFKDVRAVVFTSRDNLVSAMCFVVEHNADKSVTRIRIPASLVPAFVDVGEYKNVLNSLKEYLNSQFPSWETLMFDELDLDFPETNRFISSAEACGFEVELLKTHETPVLQTDMDFENYYRRHYKKIKKAMGNKPRLLADVGEFEVKMYTSVDEIRHGMGLVQEVDCCSWKYVEHSDMASREGQLIFWESLAYELAESGSIILFILQFRESKEPIAFEYVMYRDQKALVAKHSFKESYKRFSPGVILRFEVIKALFERGITTFDTWGIKDEFKMIWCNEVRERHTLKLHRKNI